MSRDPREEDDLREPGGAPRLGEIRERPARTEGDVKELRVKIDVSYHLKLHALKLLRNKKMSDAIEEALDYYFEHVIDETEISEGAYGGEP